MDMGLSLVSPPRFTDTRLGDTRTFVDNTERHNHIKQFCAMVFIPCSVLSIHSGMILGLFHMMARPLSSGSRFQPTTIHFSMGMVGPLYSMDCTIVEMLALPLLYSVLVVVDAACVPSSLADPLPGKLWLSGLIVEKFKLAADVVFLLWREWCLLSLTLVLSNILHILHSPLLCSPGPTSPASPLSQAPCWH